MRPSIRLADGVRRAGARAVPAAIGLALAAGTAATASAGTLVDHDGVPHLINAATPTHGIVRRQLEELWRLGGDQNDAPLIGRIDDVCAGPDGTTLLLDAQLAHVLVVSADGELLEIVGGPGEGPGEVRRPMGVVPLPDGTIGILQPHPSKIERLALDGTPAGSTRFGDGLAMVFHARSNGSDLVVAGVRVNQEAGHQDRDCFLARFDADGERQQLFLEHHYRFDFDDFVMDETRQYFPYWRFDVDRDGRVYYAAERDRYAITVASRDGTVERVIERDDTARRRADADLARVEDQFDQTARNVPFPVRKVVAPTDATIATVHVAGDGSLWVLSSHGAADQPEGILRTYDVFDRDGHFDRQVALAAPADDPRPVGRDLVVLVDPGRLVVRLTRPADDGDGDADGDATGGASDATDGDGDATGGDADAPTIIAYVLR
jgi:hypothetical protein